MYTHRHAYSWRMPARPCITLYHVSTHRLYKILRRGPLATFATKIVIMASQIPVAQQRQRVRSKRGPGKGLLDWIKLCRSFRTNQQADPDRVITFEELRKHNTEDDCWTAFRGNVAFPPRKLRSSVSIGKIC